MVGGLAARGAQPYPFVKPLRLLLIGRQLLLPLLDVGRGLEQRRRQLGVVPLQGLELRLPVLVDVGGTGDAKGTKTAVLLEIAGCIKINQKSNKVKFEGTTGAALGSCFKLLCCTNVPEEDKTMSTHRVLYN